MVLPIAVLYLLGPSEAASRMTSVTAWWSLAAIIVLGVLGTAMALILFNHLVQIGSNCIRKLGHLFNSARCDVLGVVGR